MAVPDTAAAAPEGDQEFVAKLSATSSVVDVAIPVGNNVFSGVRDVPPFSLKGDRYDQKTYYGRFRKMLDVVDPRTLLCSQRDINDAVNLLKNFEKHQQSKKENYCHDRLGDSELWQARKIRDAVLHPDTNELIPMPFRMSGFLPFNAPVCVGALMATSTPSVLLFHWLNQTHNALINYHNRNATQPLEFSTILKGYCGAVGGAIGVAMGLKTTIERSRTLSAVQKLKYQRFIGLPALMTAGAINVLLMRSGELATGINVYYDQEKSVVASDVANNETVTPVMVGSSQIAAKKALKEMVISRMVMPMPVFLLTPLGMSLVEPIVRKNRRLLALPFNSAFVLMGFALGLPATIALFPQIGTVEASDLEERFQNLQDPQGNAVTIFRYNKGL